MFHDFFFPVMKFRHSQVLTVLLVMTASSEGYTGRCHILGPAGGVGVGVPLIPLVPLGLLHCHHGASCCQRQNSNSPGLSLLPLSTWDVVWALLTMFDIFSLMDTGYKAFCSIKFSPPCFSIPSPLCLTPGVSGATEPQLCLETCKQVLLPHLPPQPMNLGTSC